MKNKKLVVLMGIEHGNMFYTSNRSTDPTKLVDGTTAYQILGYADTGDEAREIIFANPEYKAKVSQALIFLKATGLAI